MGVAVIACTADPVISMLLRQRALPSLWPGNDRMVARTAMGSGERTTPMSDDEQSASGMMSGMVQDFMAQLRAMTGGLQDLAGSGERLMPAPGAFLLPGALSAAQLGSIAGSVAAQRRSIEALKAQLSAFDEQLAVLEQILAPLADWSRTWAELEQRLLMTRRAPEAEGTAGGA